MKFLKKKINKFRRELRVGRTILNDGFFKSVGELNQIETSKKPRRSDIINFLLTLTEAKYYLEIGVRDPQKNFNKIKCENKFSVDPGVEFLENPVDYKMTSDDFFYHLEENKIDNLINIQFDIIFIDGLHIADQVEKDIANSLNFIKDDGFIVLHDCNPPSEFHQRECYEFLNSPAGPFWNGTTWKAFYKYRHHQNLFSICFDSDWGIGVISKKKVPFFNNIEEPKKNEFYEYDRFNQNRREFLNLCFFEEWKKEIIN